jgi:hypothetical protein
MRLSPRSSDDEAPSRGPVAAYAAVLDGCHLWLAIEAMPGTLSLRDPESGDLLPLNGDVDDGLKYRAVRANLTQLPTPANPEVAYDVMLKSSRLLPARHVWTPPLKPLAPARVPPAPDGVTQFRIDRTESGHLRVLRRPLPVTAELVLIEPRGGSVHLVVRPPDGVQAGTHLLLLDTEDDLIGNLPMTGQDGTLEALLGVDDLPAGHFGVIRLALGTPEDWVRIRRRRSDLADPNAAVLLPELYGDDLDRPRARFRWAPDSLLTVRVLDPDEAAGPGGVLAP